MPRRAPVVRDARGAAYGLRVTVERRGYVYGAAAYVLWGVFPLYFTLLEPATPLEILAERIVWSLAVCLGALLLLLRRVKSVLRLTRAQMRLLAVAAVLLSVNWLTFVYAATTGQVIEASLGYFINPLVTVALGVVLLSERLTHAQWAALAVAVLAVGVLAAIYGRIPWIALTLAFSFGFYGLMKKRAGVGALEGLAFETGVLFLPAAGYLIWAGAAGGQTFFGWGVGHSLLLAGLGLITTAPLLLFGAAATRIPLTSLGLLQYIAPVLQFMIGVAVLGESMPAARWVGFGLVWVSLGILTADMLRRMGHGKPLSTAAAAGEEPAAAAVEVQLFAGDRDAEESE
jgi:chloramphenicol-sensitive protein RarD